MQEPGNQQQYGSQSSYGAPPENIGAPIPPPVGGYPAPSPYPGVNDSGTGATAVLPAELKGFNWGAFLLNWIWAIGHSSWIGLLALIPYVNLIMIFVLGFKGNEWAWQNRKWDSIEHFRATQRVWAMWGVGIIVVSLVLGFGLGLLGAILGAGNR